MGKHLDVAIVQWDDSMCKSRWHTAEQMPEGPDRCITVGFVMARTKTHITLAQSLASDGLQDNSWVIPRKTIKSITILSTLERPE